MSEIVGLKITNIKNLQKDKHYQVRMMAELDKIKLPFYLHYVFSSSHCGILRPLGTQWLSSIDLGHEQGKSLAGPYPKMRVLV